LGKVLPTGTAEPLFPAQDFRPPYLPVGLVIEVGNEALLSRLIWSQPKIERSFFSAGG
jgi:hypothetical protein